MPQYRALCRRVAERERRWDIRFGVPLAHYFNAHSAQGSRSHQPGDFYGHHIPAEEQSDDDMLAAMQAYTRQHNKRLAKQADD
jgi:hypothetical protein